MLIDFKKAFDSALGKFMYHTLKFYGFGKHRIKVLNSDMNASVKQVGIKSDFFPLKEDASNCLSSLPFIWQN